MKKISILSLILFGGLYISNANALKVSSDCIHPYGTCYASSEACGIALTDLCYEIGERTNQKSYVTGKIHHSSCYNITLGVKCYNCSGSCIVGSSEFTIDTTTSDKPTTLSEDPNFGTTTSTTAPKSKNLKK